MLELRNITKKFNRSGNTADLRIALDHINLKINDGEFVTIIGSNGSGKSTTLNIITGSKYPDEGKILLSGMDITNYNEYQRAKYFGRVFQDPMMGTTAEMSAIENLEIAFRRGKKHSWLKWGFSNETVKDYFKSLLKEFNLGLEDRLNQKVGVMSGGQRQALTLLMAATDTRLDTRKEFIKMYTDIHTGESRRKLAEISVTDLRAKKVAFKKLKEEKQECARISGAFYDEQKAKFIEKSKSNDPKVRLDAFIEFSNSLHEYNQDRKILLLDEHTAALDPKTAKKVLELTNKIVREKNLTTLMITHNMRDAITYGDRLIMFHGGHIIHDFNKEEKGKLTVEKLLKLFDEADEQ